MLTSRVIPKTIFLIWILLGNFFFCSGSLESSYSKLQYGYRLDRRMIDSFTDYSILDCVEECLRRKRCKSISYYQGAHYCETNYENRRGASSMYIQDSGWIYSDIEDWDKEIIGACSNANCRENEKCNHLSLGEFKCVLSDCGVPRSENISFDAVERWDGIGIYRRIHLKCAENYRQTGSQQFICQSNGKWKTDLNCESACPKDWDEFDGHCYFYGEENLSWHDAKRKCESEEAGAYLVEVKDKRENEYLVETFHNTFEKRPCTGSYPCPVWTGANDIDTEGVFTWSRSKNKVIYSNWYPPEPNNIGNQDCVTFLRTGFWDDEHCNKKIPFICEKD